MYKKHLGQYMTINDELQELISNLIFNNPSRILEPSFGQGDLIIKPMVKFPETYIDCYEIDPDLIPYDFNNKVNIKYCDFFI